MQADPSSTIDGVQILPLVDHADRRGALLEIYRREWLGHGEHAVQANLSMSRAGVLRGLHWHRRQRDYWCVLDGRAFVALVDVRSGSPTSGTTLQLRVDSSEQRFGIAIPPGVAHGFFAETDVSLLYLVDRYYRGDDEFGLAWDDADLPIDWPTREPILSDRDRSNPPLSSVLRQTQDQPLG